MAYQLTEEQIAKMRPGLYSWYACSSQERKDLTVLLGVRVVWGGVRLVYAGWHDANYVDHSQFATADEERQFIYELLTSYDPRVVQLIKIYQFGDWSGWTKVTKEQLKAKAESLDAWLKIPPTQESPEDPHGIVDTIGDVVNSVYKTFTDTTSSLLTGGQLPTTRTGTETTQPQLPPTDTGSMDWSKYLKYIPLAAAGLALILMAVVILGGRRRR